jgi:sugar phosphate isomerase/epimerase
MIGLGSYAFFWAHKNGLTLESALQKTHDLGVGLFQICDFAPLETMTPAALAAVRRTADDFGIDLEVGTRGLAAGHIRRHLEIADALGATLLRSMVDTSVDEAAAQLDAIIPDLDAAGVTLALETYERIPTAALVGLVERADHVLVGICLDPANTVAILENPREVIELTRPHVRNIHVKDFAFSRRDGWVGFTLAGAPLGEGLLDIDHLMTAATAQTNRIIEHWLPWQGDAESTVALEAEWTRRNLDHLRSHQ